MVGSVSSHQRIRNFPPASECFCNHEGLLPHFMVLAVKHVASLIFKDVPMILREKAVEIESCQYSIKVGK